MTNSLHEAISQISDDYIVEAAETIGQRKPVLVSWKKIAVLAACLAVIIISIPTTILIVKHYAEDPIWFETHAEANSAQEAAVMFGDDLLLGNLALTDSEYPYDFKSTLEWSEGGSLENRSTWEKLESNIHYFHEDGSSADWTYLTMFFQEDDLSINGNDEVVGFDSIFNGSEKTTVINGIEVTYVELTDDKMYSYNFAAKFVYNNYLCYYSSLSANNDKLAWDVLNQMLNN